MILSIQGIKRSAKVSVAAYDKHKDVIRAYVDGADIEEISYSRWDDVLYPSSLTFQEDTEYRVKSRYELDGEIWVDSDSTPYLITDRYQVNLKENTVHTDKVLTYCASSLDDYYQVIAPNGF